MHGKAGKGRWLLDQAGSEQQWTTYIFNDMAMITDEEECSRILQVELHADQAVRMTR